MMSDRLVYKFQGTVFSSLDHTRISSVRVKASCEKTRLDPPLETYSDDKGVFILEGYFSGALDDCELNFEHPKFKRTTVKLKPEELKADRAYLVWSIDVELEPK